MAELLAPEHPCFDPDDPEGAHDWEFHSDWYGDPGVVNGTCTFYFFRCRVCEAEKEADASDAPTFEDY